MFWEDLGSALFILGQIMKLHYLIYFLYIYIKIYTHTLYLSAEKTFQVWMVTNDEYTVPRNTGLNAIFGRLMIKQYWASSFITCLVQLWCTQLSDLSVY